MNLINSNFNQGIICEQEQMSYQEVQKFANTLCKYIPKRCLVFSLCSNSIGSLCGYVGFIENSIVPVMLDSEMDNEILEKLIVIYKPHFLWVESEKVENFRVWEKVVDIYNYTLLKNPDQIVHNLHGKLALLLTTSGSTGSPKFVRLSYKNILSNAESIAKYLEIDENERPITSLPMHYSYGLSVINSHLIKGASILLTCASVVSKDFWNFFKEHKATSFAGVPYTYQILKQFRLLRHDLSSLKTLTQAGGKLSSELVSEFGKWAADNGKRFFVMYGQTEATARMSYLPCDKTLEKSASIGVAIPNGEFKLLDNYDNIIYDANVAGELIYKGENVSMGYAENLDDLSKGDENGGVLRTGDVAQRDSDDFYYIVGRLKRFIKIFGNRVNLDQVEQLCKQITPNVACAGVDDKLNIYIVDASLETQIKQFIAQKTGLHSSAIAVTIISEIPKNSSGKTQYSKL